MGLVAPEEAEKGRVTQVNLSWKRVRPGESQLCMKRALPGKQKVSGASQRKWEICCRTVLRVGSTLHTQFCSKSRPRAFYRD